MTTTKLRSAWDLFRQALAGDTDLNYTEGSIARVTILLAIPMILEMAMESVFRDRRYLLRGPTGRRGGSHRWVSPRR